MAVSGYRDGPPTRCGVAVGDFGSGVFTALAIVAAVYHAAQTGEGQVVDISMQDSIWLMVGIEHTARYFLEGVVAPRVGNGHPSHVPADLYPASDGWVFITTINIDRMQALIAADRGGGTGQLEILLGQESERLVYRDEIDALISSWTKTKTVAELSDLLGKAGVAYQRRRPRWIRSAGTRMLLRPGNDYRCGAAGLRKVTVPGSLFKMSKTPGDVRPARSRPRPAQPGGALRYGWLYWPRTTKHWRAKR